MPSIGDRFKSDKHPRKTFSFISEQMKGDVVWWQMIEIDSGKYYNFYPDDVRPANVKGKKRTRAIKETPVIEEGREPKQITIAGETITVL